MHIWLALLVAAAPARSENPTLVESSGTYVNGDRPAREFGESERESRTLPEPKIPSFDGENRAPLAVELAWGTSPRSAAYARNADTVMRLYGYAGDKLINRLAPRPDGGSAILARLAKLPVDAGLALLSNYMEHEMGHLDQGLLSGGRMNWNFFQGYVEGNWKDHPGPAALQAFSAAGVNATQASSQELRRMMLSQDRTYWPTLLHSLAMKFDITHYSIATKRSPQPAPLNEPDDLRAYSTHYSARRGQPLDKVYRQILIGGMWNAVDPAVFYAAASYIWDYVIHGRGSVPRPTIALGGWEFSLGTGFWLSETGPQYLLNLFSRTPGGPWIEVSPQFGDNGQWGIFAGLSGATLSRALSLKAGLGLWNQDASAEGGGRTVGGAAQGGVSLTVDPVEVRVEGGYKTRGAMLGKPFEAGPFCLINARASF